MIDSNIRIKILDEYKKFFEKNHLSVGTINYFLNEFNLDPLNAESFTISLKKLKSDRDKIVIPKLISEKRVLTGTKENFITMERNATYKDIKIYQDCSEKEVHERQIQMKAIDNHIYIIKNMQDITIFFLTYSKVSDAGHQNNKPTKDKLKRGLLKQIVTATLESIKFKALNIQKDKTLTFKQQKALFDLACNLYPDVPIKFSSFISEVKQRDYSKGQHNPRKGKNNKSN